MNTEYEKIVGNNIRKIREQAKMTQEILATKLQLSGCDITRSAVAKIEVGQRHIYPDEIRLIKEILSTTFEKSPLPARDLPKSKSTTAYCAVPALSSLTASICDVTALRFAPVISDTKPSAAELASYATVMPLN